MNKKILELVKKAVNVFPDKQDSINKPNTANQAPQNTPPQIPIPQMPKNELGGYAINPAQEVNKRQSLFNKYKQLLEQAKILSHRV